MIVRPPFLLLTLIFSLFAFGGEGDSLVLEPKVATYNYDAIPKDPLASAFFSATFPGTGELYNKEYLRGILTAVGFYGGFFTFQYMLDRWDALNLDTFYIEEAYPPYNVHQVTSPKPDSLLEGLPTGEKVILGASAALMIGSYVWGIYDAYQGAKRYNKKLTTASRPVTWDVAYLSSRKRPQLTATLHF